MGTTAQNSDRSSLTITLLVPSAPHLIVQTPHVEPGREAMKERGEPACLTAADFMSGIDDHLEVVSLFIFLYSQISIPLMID